MHCFSCDVILTEREQKRKFANHIEIVKVEDKYINLCESCMLHSDLVVQDVENPNIFEEF
jgi:hypothetical protein